MHYSGDFCSLLNIRAHSLLRKILPNSAGQFAKFRGSLRQNYPNSAAYCGLSLVHDLSFIPLKKLQFLDAGMTLTYASNIERKLSRFFSFQKCNLSISCIVLIYDCAIYDGNY